MMLQNENVNSKLFSKSTEWRLWYTSPISSFPNETPSLLFYKIWTSLPATEVIDGAFEDQILSFGKQTSRSWISLRWQIFDKSKHSVL